MLDEEELRLAVASAIQRVDQPETKDPIIIQFNHRAAWLWRQWRGTAIELVWRPVLVFMAIAGAIEGLVPDGAHAWVPPDASHPVVAKLLTLHTAWAILLPLSTFVLTFFLSQCASYWRSMFAEGRSIQGRLHDTNLLLAAHARRDGQGVDFPVQKPPQPHARSNRQLRDMHRKPTRANRVSP